MISSSSLHVEERGRGSATCGKDLLVITTAGTQGKPTTAITSATAVSAATSEAGGLFWDAIKSRDVSSNRGTSNSTNFAEQEASKMSSFLTNFLSKI
jgi:hypothetical protein